MNYLSESVSDTVHERAYPEIGDANFKRVL